MLLKDVRVVIYSKKYERFHKNSYHRLKDYFQSKHILGGMECSLTHNGTK